MAVRQRHLQGIDRGARGAGIEAVDVERLSDQVADRRVAAILEAPASEALPRLAWSSGAPSRPDVAPGTPLLLLRRSYYDAQGVPIHYSDLYLRSDRFVYKIELFRHHQQVELARPAAGGSRGGYSQQ